MTANTSTPDFNELLSLIPDASEFSIDNEKFLGGLKEIYDSIEEKKDFESLESIKIRLSSKGLTNDDLIEFAANQILWNEVTAWHNEELQKLNEGLTKLLELYRDHYEKSTNAHNCLHQLNEISEKFATTASFLEGKIKGVMHKKLFWQNKVRLLKEQNMNH